MKNQRGYAFIVLLIMVCILILLVGIWIDSVSCHSKWDNADMAAVSYGPIKGCMVKLPDGRWLPADRMREIDLPKRDSK